jgi:hypothetical protein
VGSAPDDGHATHAAASGKTDAPDITMSWSFPSVMWNESDYFFNTTIRFSEVGKWLVVVTSGSNWGCFLLDELGG